MALVANQALLNTQITQTEKFKEKSDHYGLNYEALERQNAVNLLFNEHVVDKMAVYAHLDKIKQPQPDNQIRLSATQNIPLEKPNVSGLDTYMMFNTLRNLYHESSSKNGYFRTTSSTGDVKTTHVKLLSFNDFLDRLFEQDINNIQLIAPGKDNITKDQLVHLKVMHGLSNIHANIKTIMLDAIEIAQNNQSCFLDLRNNSLLSIADKSPQEALEILACMDLRNIQYETNEGIFTTFTTLLKEAAAVSALKPQFEAHKVQNRKLMIKETDKQGLIKEHSLQNMSFDEFKSLVKKHGISNISFQKTEQLTLNELEARNILNRKSGSSEYSLNPSYEYTGLGIQSRSRIGSTSLNIVNMEKRENHDGKFYLEVCSHIPRQGNLDAQGHASIKLVTNQGYVMSIGLFQNGENPSQAVLQTPDHIATLSPRSYTHTTTKIEIPNEEGFINVLKYVEKQNNERTSYSLLNDNCAKFAYDVARYAQTQTQAKVARQFSINGMFSRTTERVRLYFLSCYFSFGQSIRTQNYYNLFRTVYIPSQLHVVL